MPPPHPPTTQSTVPSTTPNATVPGEPSYHEGVGVHSLTPRLAERIR